VALDHERALALLQQEILERDEKLGAAQARARPRVEPRSCPVLVRTTVSSSTAPW
jgi:hypothetical protein